MSPAIPAAPRGWGFSITSARISWRSCRDLRPGDVPVFVETVTPCHTGLMSTRHGVPHLIHAHALRGRVIEEPFAGDWAARLRFAFRFPQLLEDT